MDELLESFVGDTGDAASGASQIRKAVQVALLQAMRDELEADGPSLGNLEGDVVIVEFFDYQCGYCRRVFGPLMEVVADDGNVKVLVREYPIFGEASVNAAKAALAAHKQGKYEAFHRALIGIGRADPAAIETAAFDAGVDLDRMLTDMEGPDIALELARNRKLAQAIALRGTPSFVVGSTFVGGAISADAMRKIIAQARSEG